MNIQEQLIDFDLLGKEVEDKVTGFKGIATSISYDLYGCVQAVVTPKYLTPKENKDDTIPRGTWFDTKRLTVLNSNPVMQVPDFSKPVGGYEKPDYSEKP